MANVTNVVFVGLGGQGVLTASDILAEAAFADGHDVKKSEIHGMAQRGGSVTSDVRYGKCVYSPMIPPGEADYVVVLDSTQIDYASRFRKPQGLLIAPHLIGEEPLDNQRSMNVALLGIIAPYLSVTTRALEAALLAHLKPELQRENIRLFRRMCERTRALS